MTEGDPTRTKVPDAEPTPSAVTATISTLHHEERVSPIAVSAEPESRRAWLIVTVFAAAIFLNAALLFAVQPMFTKMVLPLLGGSPGVWNTCLLFFQAALLGGYLYAHVTSRWWTPRRQATVHIVLLLASLAVLPIHIPRSWSHPPIGSLPIPWLLGLLAISLGLPFSLLAAGAPMLQRWFASTRHRSAQNPYFLYAASNLGSFAALLAYPVVIEPRLRVSEQTVSWLELFYALIVLIAVCAVAAWAYRARGEVVDTSRGVAPVLEGAENAENGHRAEGAEKSYHAENAESAEATQPVERRGALRGSVRHLVEENPDAERLREEEEEEEVIVRRSAEPTIIPDRHWRLRWVLLSFAPSSLLIGTTTYLSTDIASVPLLWVVPLALYLLTFVIVFAKRPLLNRRFMLVMQLILGLALIVSICLGPGRRITTQAALHLLAFFATAMVCHRELADSRPRAEYLTEFYLWMSFGGVLGGVFNVILAPLLYNSLVEYPFALVIAFGLRPSRSKAYGGRRAFMLDVLLPALVCAAVWGGFRLPKPPDEWGRYGTQFFLGAMAAIVALFWKRPLRLALGVGAIYLGVRFADASTSDIIIQRRSFFGLYRVRRMLEYNVLQNGTTTHGAQSQAPERRLEPITYYYRGGPLGQIFDSVAYKEPLRRVAVVGLGTGTAACYGRPGEQWDYYEIDPLVVAIARSSLFTYIKDCPPKVNIVLGDARLSLAKVRDSTYDLIILDAFTSDAIPIHLLTREALQLYLRKLKDGGAVAFHISNRYVDLRPVLIGLAVDLRVPGALGDRDVASDERLKLYYGSRWVILAKHASVLGGLLRLYGWSPLPPEPATRVWTDDFSDIISVLRW